MKEELFEGFVGIRLAEGQLGNDIVLSLFLVMLVLFAIHFRRNIPYYVRIPDNLIHVKERQSLFDESIGNVFGSHVFGSLQFVFLNSLICFMLFVSAGSISSIDPKTTLLYIAVFFVVLLVFFLFKQAMYAVIGRVFADPKKYHLWKSSYYSTIDFWGILLYLPALLLLFSGKAYSLPIILLVLFYAINRLILILKAFRIFFNKKTAFVLLILYLCALEIMPLLFLYEGLLYVNHIIEINSLWL